MGEYPSWSQHSLDVEAWTRNVVAFGERQVAIGLTSCECRLSLWPRREHAVDWGHLLDCRRRRRDAGGDVGRLGYSPAPASTISKSLATGQLPSDSTILVCFLRFSFTLGFAYVCAQRGGRCQGSEDIRLGMWFPRRAATGSATTEHSGNCKKRLSSRMQSRSGLGSYTIFR